VSLYNDGAFGWLSFGCSLGRVIHSIHVCLYCVRECESDSDAKCDRPRTALHKAVGVWFALLACTRLCVAKQDVSYLCC
jgi:hypothetical protein